MVGRKIGATLDTLHAFPGRILALFPRAAFVVVPGAGHWVHAEAPEPFLRALEPFLAMEA